MSNVDMTMTASKHQAAAWDPTAPFSLALCPAASSTTTAFNAYNAASADSNKEASLDIFLSHDATGIHPVETTCLHSLLDERDGWIESKRNGASSSSRGGVGEVVELSKRYRRAVCACLIDLGKARNNNTNGDAMDEENEDGSNVDNYEYLTVIYAMMHLNEIYLLPSPRDVLALRRDTLAPRGGGGGQMDKLKGPPGSLTADTVRYLRLHHTPYDINSEAVKKLLEMDQPEYYTPSNNPTNDSTNIDSLILSDPLFSGPYNPYHNLLLHLFTLGNLTSAWAVLSRHSSCRRAEEEALKGSLSKEGEGWGALRAVLLSAPLPGGRGEEDDSGLVDDDDVNNDSMSDGNRVNGDNIEVEIDTDYNTRLIPDIPRSSPCLWEPHPKSANILRQARHRRKCLSVGIEPQQELEVLPETYSEAVAMNIFTTWQRTVKNLMHGALSVLFVKFPQLRQIYSILLGASPGGSWAEVLLVELLYGRPNISPEDIGVRARVAMGGGEGGVEKVILRVMEGGTVDAVAGIYEFGGGSGGALPAALTCLMSNLLVEAKIITNSAMQTELLVSASESILSSFAVQGQSDVGVRAAVRLLLPHAPPQRIAGEIVYEPRIAATISNAISHRRPDSDAEAKNLLQLTEEMICRGSVRIADACESMTFCRTVHHGRKGDLVKQVYWLLRGMEIISVWLPEEYRRTVGFASRRHFDVLCEKVADELLLFLSAAQSAPVDGEHSEKLAQGTKLAFNRANNVLEAVFQDDSMSNALKTNVEVALLHHMVEIATHDAKSDYTQMAAHIIHCLEERPSGGKVITLANSNMYYRLLYIAVSILNEEEAMYNGTMASTSCAFTVHGMHILMARLNQVLIWEKTSDKADYLSKASMALCKGLMRANACGPKEEVKKVEKKEMSLEDEVALMLSPSI